MLLLPPLNCLLGVLCGTYFGVFSDCPGSLAGGVVAYHVIRREFIRICGSWAMAWMTFQPCFLAVEMKDGITAKSVAPAVQRKPPEIFCLTFIMRASRSA